MRRMSGIDSVGNSLAFTVGKLGALAASRFAEALAPDGLKPRHCAVLELAGDNPLSQLELATRIGVAPSVVVDMLDELEALGAVQRIPAANDRRRHLVQLTPHGRELSRRAVSAVQRVDAELLAGLTLTQQRSLRSGLQRIASKNGLNP
jgi:DNA-binding MarR family transcriptional regulator